ncbi:hypothetical protein [uncultured Nitratireductor sp.]|uniref:hypothetical protein n=1 Tax=uncultured Nitratireductor sp. TaxID=520953 RepID=UPI00262CDA9B|nr:hypothetical protein [uncultured Nitratireductor sp.]
MRLKFSAGTVALSVNNPDAGRATISVACTYAGEELEVGFNASYLKDMILRAAPDKTDVVFKLASVSAPALLNGSISGWSGVLMPVRI